METKGLAGVGVDAVEGDWAGLRCNDLGGGMIGVDLPLAGNLILEDEGLDFGAAVVEQEILLVYGDGAALEHAVLCLLVFMGGGARIFDMADGGVHKRGGFFVGVILGGVGQDAAVFVNVDFLGVQVRGDGVRLVVFGTG